MRILSLVLLVLCVSCSNIEKKGGDESPLKFATFDKKNVYYYIEGLEKPFKAMFLADTHFTVEDERGLEYYDYSKRMGGSAVEPENYGKSNGRDVKLLKSLNRANSDSAEIVVLGGDIINFPSLASVEALNKMLDDSGLNWAFISGNHDWHYEGEPGTADDSRNKWEEKNLKPLYKGNNPLYYSVKLNGINFILIDNSTNEIIKEQLDFVKEELKKGMPSVVCMHIPLYLQGHESVVSYGCGNPYWNKENDIYYEIERRLPWPEEGHTAITYEFRELVLNNPQVIGIFAGHTHELAVDMVNNKLQYVVGANHSGNDVMIHFIPAEN